MAKSAAQPDPAVILKGLRKALSGSRPLMGDGDEPLFPKGAPGKKLAAAAVEQGFLSIIEIGAGKKKTPYGELTEKGRSYVLAADDPKPILESLLSALKTRNAAPDSSAPSSPFLNAVEKASADAVKSIEQAIAKQQEAVTKAIEKLASTLAASLSAHAPPPAADLGPSLSALQATLERVSAPTPASAPPTRQAVSSGSIEDAIVLFVESWAKEKSVGCQFDVLWKDLKESNPTLTVGQFQDALRSLYDARRIRLGGWAGMQDEIPKPELAFFVSSKVMYYAHPADSHA